MKEAFHLASAILLLIGALPAARGAQYDCAAGCPDEYAPVCGRHGSDSITLLNGCVAFCHGIKTVLSSPCPGDPLKDHTKTTSGSRAQAQTAAWIPEKALKRFRREGFILQSKATFAEEWERPTATSPERKAFPTGGLKHRAMRLTRDGYQYVQTEETARRLQVSPLSHGASVRKSAVQGDQPRRKLPVFVPDDRVLQTRAQSQAEPNKYIGPLYIFEKGSSKRIGNCTGSVVGQNAVLTAGHCVRQGLFKYIKTDPEHSYGSFVSNIRFAPGSYNVTQGGPYGIWDWETITIPLFFATYDVPSWDFAIITFHPKNGVYIGDYLGGHMYVKSPCDGGTLQQPDPLYTIGYPNDKYYYQAEVSTAEVSRIWGNAMPYKATCSNILTSCTVPESDTASAIPYSVQIASCDVHQGQSGSPVFDDSMNIYGIVTTTSRKDFALLSEYTRVGNPKGEWNGITTMVETTNSMYNRFRLVVSWGADGKNTIF